MYIHICIPSTPLSSTKKKEKESIEEEWNKKIDVFLFVCLFVLKGCGKQPAIEERAYTDDAEKRTYTVVIENVSTFLSCTKTTQQTKTFTVVLLTLDMVLGHQLKAFY